MASVSNQRIVVPDEIRVLSPDLHDYLQERADISNLESADVRAGESTLPLDYLNALSATPLFTAGTTAQFQDLTQGFITATYVQFQSMVAGGGPCGLVNDDTGRVTNLFSASSPYAVVGFLPNLEIPTTEYYGWVIIAGNNLVPSQLKAGDSSALGDELYWSGNGELTVAGEGIVIASQKSPAVLTSELPIGAAGIAIGSSTGQKESAAIISTVEGLQLEVDANTAEIVTTQLLIVSGDEALASQIDSLSVVVADNSAEILTVSTARAAGDEALASRIDTLTVQVGDDISAAVSVESSARIQGDEAVSLQVTNLRASTATDIEAIGVTTAGLTTELIALTDSTNSTASKTDTLSTQMSFRAEGARENLLDAGDAGPETSSTGTIIKSVEILMAEAGLEIGGKISLSGYMLADEIDFLGLRITFLDAVDAEISNTGILAESDNATYFYGMIEAVEIPALTVKIVCEAVRDGFGSGSLSAKQFMLVAGESACRYPFVTGNARATTVLAARVTINEGDIFANATDITTLEVTVNDPIGGVVANASAVTTLSAEIIVIDGQLVTLEAQYSVKLNVNGRVAGFGLAATANSEGNVDTSAVFEVDTFKIWDGSTQQPPFVVDGGVVTVTELNANRLTVGSAFNSAHPVGAASAIVLDGAGKEIYLTASAIKVFQVTQAGTTLRDETGGVLLDTSGGTNSIQSQGWNAVMASTNAANQSTDTANNASQLRAVQPGATLGADLNRDVTGQIDDTNVAQLLQPEIITEVYIGNASISNAKIQGVIQSAAYNDVTKQGWKLDKDGSIQGNQITLYGPSAELLFNIGGNLNDTVGFGDGSSIGTRFQSGICRDGDTVTFLPSYSQPPLVFLGAGGLTASSTLTGDYAASFLANSITATDFVATLKLKELAAAIVPVSDSTSVVGVTQDIEIQKSTATEAYDSNYNYFGKVSVFNQATGGGSWAAGWADVGIYSNNGPAEANWVQEAIIRVHAEIAASATELVSFSKLISVLGLTNNGTGPRAFGISVVGSLIGGTINEFTRVDYSTATGTPSEVTATPSGAPGVYWFAMAGQEG